VNAADVEGEAACCSAAVAVAGEAALTVAPLPAEVFTSDTGTMLMELAETAALPLLPVVVAAAPAESVPVAEPDTLLALLVAEEPEESVEDAPAESVEDDPESVEDDPESVEDDEDDPEPSFEEPDDVEVVVVVELLAELLLVLFPFMVKVQVVTS